ncbi:MAG TPA: MATE family efflux transporter [Firmicutes bacterium]|jgi:putative MATE family efflux protein|nr:MATE family efflux transporter [Bacillota bacterium]HHT43679.1 MATE family efflux transporter [Bacillota bacterium]
MYNRKVVRLGRGESFQAEKGERSVGEGAAREDLRARILRLAWPAIVENLLHTMVGIVDTAMVGRLGAAALASVGLGNQINQLGLTVFSALATGSTALVARHIGAEEPERARDVARQSLILGLFVSGTVMIVFLSLARVLLGWLFRRSEAAVLDAASGYVRIIAVAMILNYFLIVINAILRGAGDTKTPMQITALVNVVNIIGNTIFIYGVGPVPALGVAGAALGTAVAQAVGGVLALRVLFRSELLKIRITDSFRPDLTIIRRIANIGVPAGVEQGMMRVGQLFYTMIISSLGTVSYAAHQVALNAESLSFMPGAGFATASTTLVGQNLGAQRLDDAERAGRITRNVGAAVMSAMGLVFLLIPEPIVRIFSSDPEVVALAVACLRLVGIAQPSLAIWMILAGGLRGAGDTKAIMKMVMVSFLGVRVSMAYLLAIRLELGLIGAWIAMVLDLFLRSVLIQWRFNKGKWKFVKV